MGKLKIKVWPGKSYLIYVDTDNTKQIEKFRKELKKEFSWWRFWKTKFIIRYTLGEITDLEFWTERKEIFGDL